MKSVDLLIIDAVHGFGTGNRGRVLWVAAAHVDARAVVCPRTIGSIRSALLAISHEPRLITPRALSNKKCHRRSVRDIGKPMPGGNNGVSNDLVVAHDTDEIGVAR